MAVDYTPTLGDYKELKPFRYWCQKVLPLVYDDSLSYYELLCKVVDYLNKTMEDVDTLHDDVDNLHDAYVLLQNYVNDYFDNLDVQEEINEKLDAMAQDGALSGILAPIIVSNLPPLVVNSTDEMTDRGKMYVLSSNGHLYQWDNSISAFGDTGLSYGTIANVITTRIAISEGDLNNLAPNTLTALSYPTSGGGIANNPAKDSAYVLTLQFASNANAKLQTVWKYNSNKYWTRQCRVDGTWTDWQEEEEWFKNYGIIGVATTETYPYGTLRDLNDAPNNAMISLSAPPTGNQYTNTPNGSQAPAYVFTVQWGDNSNARMQFWYAYRTAEHYYRCKTADGIWHPWMSDTALRDGGVIGLSTDTPYPYGYLRDVNDAPVNSLVSLTSPPNDNMPYTNTPNGSQDPAYLITYQWGDDIQARVQFYINYATGAQYYRAKSVAGVWSNWQQNGTVYNTKKNVTENTYTNTYNITCTPTITTDSNGWLVSTNDETDRTSDIMTMLTQNGYCHLGKGRFYVGGQIEMPPNSTLIGCGNKSKLKLLSAYHGAMLIPIEDCVVNNIILEGNGGAGANIGGEVGILIYDTKTDFGSQSTHSHSRVRIDGMRIINFNGSGIQLRGTGSAVDEGAIITNTHIGGCSVGLNISFFSEYNKIDACIIENNNYIGVVNNGGNNSFVNCTIGGSNTGFVIDNSANDLVNEAHGECIGCMFNHVGSNTGDSIRILGTNNGYLFSGCNWWYGKIRISNSKGITFNGINGGGNTSEIILTNTDNILFSSMQLNVTPSITNQDNRYLRFVNCYNFLTGASIGV